MKPLSIAPSIAEGHSALIRMPKLAFSKAAVFVSSDDDSVTLRAYASFFEAGVRPALLLMETLDGEPARALLGLQVWVSSQDGRIPAPGEARAVLG
jgi:hypothetical protein